MRAPRRACGIKPLNLYALVMYNTHNILWICASEKNDAIASERSKNHDYKVLFTLVPIFWDLHAPGGRKLYGQQVQHGLITHAVC